MSCAFSSAARTPKTPVSFRSDTKREKNMSQIRAQQRPLYLLVFHHASIGNTSNPSLHLAPHPPSKRRSPRQHTRPHLKYPPPPPPISNENDAVPRHRIPVQSRTRAPAAPQCTHALPLQPAGSPTAVTGRHRRTDRRRTLHPAPTRTARILRQHRRRFSRLPNSTVPPRRPALVRSTPGTSLVVAVPRPQPLSRTAPPGRHAHHPIRRLAAK